MNRKVLLFLAVSALAPIAFTVGAGEGRAEPQLTVKSPAPTVPFRDPNNRMQMRRVTNAERQEAAKRAAERRAAAGKPHGYSVSLPSKPAPQNTEGGTQ